MVPALPSQARTRFRLQWKFRTPDNPRMEPGPWPASFDWNGMVHRPSVLLIDDGELEEVNLLLEELDADTIRLRGDTNPDPWPWPTRLLVATSQRALSLPHPGVQKDGGLTAIAISGDASNLLRTELRRTGFDYLVRQRVHPEALRLLFQRALYSDRERRRQPRLPVGYQVTYLAG